MDGSNTNPDRDTDGYRPGSVADFERLYERECLRLTRTVYGVLGNRAEAEDCVQEAFARAYRDWASWKPNAPARFWVQKIAVNLALTRRRHERMAAVKHHLLPHRNPAPDEVAQRLDLAACLRKLSPRQAAAVLLKFNHGYNNREIGEIIGVSERAVGQRLELALRNLNEWMGPAASGAAPRREFHATVEPAPLADQGPAAPSTGTTAREPSEFRN